MSVNRKLWEQIQRLEGRDYLDQNYKKRHGRSLNGQRAYEIGACFTQGREYFASASIASETVKPLLLYYGVASLARGIILLLDRQKKEESLTPGHGLVTASWAETLNKGISEVLKIEVQATKGTFSEFVSAVGNKQGYCWRIVPSGSAGYFNHDFGEVKFLSDGSKFSLNDLLSREVDLAADFEIANGSWGNTDFADVVASDDKLQVCFSVMAGRTIEEAIAAYKFPDTSRIAVKPSIRYPALQTVCVELDGTGEALKSFAPMASRQDENVGWTVRPFGNGDNLVDIHRMYIEAFILGMLSRYFPSRWISILRSDKGDIARSVILAAVSRIENEFPRLASEITH